MKKHNIIHILFALILILILFFLEFFVERQANVGCLFMGLYIGISWFYIAVANYED